MFIALAVSMGERPDAPDQEIAEGALRVRRYFAQALPLHVDDEEESILPRLYGRSADVDGALDRMRSEHAEHAAPLRRLLASVAGLAEAPRDRGLRSETLAASKELLAQFEPHLAAEERIIFPAISALLSPGEQQAIVGELRARRTAT